MSFAGLTLVLILLALVAIVAFVAGIFATLHTMHKLRPDLYDAWQAHCKKEDDHATD